MIQQPKPMPPDRIEGNIAASRIAKEILNLVRDSILDAAGPLSVDRLYEILANTAAEKIGRVVVLPNEGQCMSDAEAIEFEKYPIPRGYRYSGQDVRNVDPSFLNRVAADEWHKQLRRYVRSKRFAEIHK